MYNKTTDTYTCDICGYENKWDSHDEVHGELWSCESCGTTFCSKCFIEELGWDAYHKMMQSDDLVSCPDCYKIMREENENDVG